jgi:hypothetical protein
MTGLHGPRRLRVERVPPGWALKEILVNGIDATDRPIAFGSWMRRRGRGSRPNRSR